MAIEKIRIVAVDEPALGFPAPVRYFIADPTGDTLVIKVMGKRMHPHDSPPGAGSGMIGSPGDFTPPSWFVRAVAFTQSARGRPVAMTRVR